MSASARRATAMRNAGYVPHQLDAFECSGAASPSTRLKLRRAPHRRSTNIPNPCQRHFLRGAVYGVAYNASEADVVHIFPALRRGLLATVQRRKHGRQNE